MAWGDARIGVGMATSGRGQNIFDVGRSTYLRGNGHVWAWAEYL